MDWKSFRMRGRTTVVAAAVMVSLAAAPAVPAAFAQNEEASLPAAAQSAAATAAKPADGSAAAGTPAADASQNTGARTAGKTGAASDARATAGARGVDGADAPAAAQSARAAADAASKAQAADAATATDATTAAVTDAADADQQLAAMNGWEERDGQSYWYDDGVMAASKEVYDPDSNAWYWFDADGTMAHDKDVYLPDSNKWVRYDSDGHMIKGEDNRYGGWYFFDEVTGEMAKGVQLIEGGDGWKWVYYDVVTGQMAHNEALLTYDDEHNGWYLFDEISGAMQYGWQVPGGQKTVYYDEVTGQMVHGEAYIPQEGSVPGSWRYFDDVTGELFCGWKWIDDGEKLVYYDPSQEGAMSYGAFTDRYGVGYRFDAVTGALQATVNTYDVGTSRADFAAIQGVEEKYVYCEGWNGGSGNINLLRFADLRRSQAKNTVTADQVNLFIESTASGREGTLRGHGQDVIDAANQYGIDAVYLLAHAIIESGWGTSSLSSGEYWEEHTFDGVTYPAGNYYNFFGWGAFDSSPYKSGMNYAQKNGWSSVREALVGGAQVISKGYINSGRTLTGTALNGDQKTLFEMRYDPQYTAATGQKSDHEYATDPNWAASIASVMASFYEVNDIEPDYQYVIPTYN